MYLLDTNVVSELRRVTLGHPNVLKWAKGIDQDDFFVSAITIMELEIGCLRLERRDAIQGRLLRDWLQNVVLEQFESRVLPVDLYVAQQTALLHVPDPKPERDAFIAATSIIHDLTLVTRNTKDFARTGVRLLNPWLVM
jgi:toxin FitB